MGSVRKNRGLAVVNEEEEAKKKKKKRNHRRCDHGIAKVPIIAPDSKRCLCDVCGVIYVMTSSASSSSTV